MINNCHALFLGTGQRKVNLGSTQTFLVLIFLIPDCLIQRCGVQIWRLHYMVGSSSGCQFCKPVSLSISPNHSDFCFIFLHLSNFLTSLYINLINHFSICFSVCGWYCYTAWSSFCSHWPKQTFWVLHSGCVVLHCKEQFIAYWWVY